METLLDLRHYEAIVAIVDAGSVTAAARQLTVSQSAVSHRLADAERRIGVALFDRRPARALQPTPAGLALYQAAARALPELQRAETDVLRSAGQAAEVVRLGVGSYDCYHWLPDFHRLISDELPNILIELVIVGASPAARLADRSVDVVLAPGQPEGIFDSTPLFTDELVLLCHPEHALADLEWVDPHALEGEVFLTYSHKPWPGFEYERFVRPAGVAPRTVMVIEQTGAIASMVASGLGVAILSRWASAPWIDTGQLIAVPCGRDGLSLQWCSLMRAGTPQTSPEHQVAQLLASWLRGR